MYVVFRFLDESSNLQTKAESSKAESPKRREPSPMLRSSGEGDGIIRAHAL